MPYTAITPFRHAVQSLLDNPYPRLEFHYQGTVATYPDGDPTTDPYTIAEFSYEGGFAANWHEPHIGVLDYQGGDANNPRPALAQARHL